MDAKYNKNYLSWLFIVLLIIVGAYLTVKATYENSWDGWAFGSAQTIMSIEHWVKDGWTNHYFLFIPVSYSKVTRYFNDPELNQHAWVNVTGKPGEKRIYYTHYPSGYLFPLAFLMELGLKNRFWFRFFQILLSLTSLLLLYKFFNLIAGRTIAFFAALFYMLSVPFLNFADSLANMPIDDFFRFLILLLSILALKSIENAKKNTAYNFWIWFGYFLLAISSCDSTFFVFAWLVGLDIITMRSRAEGEAEPRIKKFLRIFLVRGKKWLFFASAPILAFIFQIIQNSWYLGFSGMVSDFINIFKKIGLGAGSSQGFIQMHFLQGILYPITETFAFPFRARYVLISFLIILVALFILKKNKETEKSIPSMFKYLFLFGMAGFIQSLIVLDNHPYKGRVLGVFAAFLIGAFIFLLFHFRKTKPIPYFLLLNLFLMTTLMIFFQAQRTLAYIRQWPNNVYNQNTINLTKELKADLQPLHLQDIVVFILFPLKSQELVDAAMMAGNYYTASCQDMYYYNAPILLFDNIPKMAIDFTYLKKISKYPFSALMIMKDKNQANELIQLLQKTSPKLSEESIKSFIIQDKYILLFNTASE